MADKKPATVNELLRAAVMAEMDRQKIVSPLDLATRARINAQIVRRLLSGVGMNPTLDNLAGLLHGLGKSWEWLADKIRPAYDKATGPRTANLRAANMAAKLKAAKPAKKKAKPKPGKTKPPSPKKVTAPAAARTGGNKPAKRVGAAHKSAQLPAAAPPELAKAA